MELRRNCFVLVVLLLVLSSPSRSAEPELKAGVRLRLGGSRFQGWIAPEVVDWDNDGLNDLVVGHYSGRLAVYLNRGVGKAGISFRQIKLRRLDSFGSRGEPIWGWRFNKANCVCPGPGRLCPRVLDWDNDGKKDLVIGDGCGAQTRVWRNVGTDKAPIFSTRHLQYLPPDGGARPYHETVAPWIADWNGDGNKDLIMGRNRGIYVYVNRGTDAAPKFDFDRARLGMKIRNVFPTERLSPVFIDWDSDGRKDLIVGSQQGEVWFARNVGTPAQPKFKSYARVQADRKPIQMSSQARIAVSDLDGDGRRDLLVGDGTGVVWFFQARQPAPIARSRFVEIKGGGALPVGLVGTDDARRALTYRVLTQPKSGRLEGTAPNLRYTPNKDFTGRDQFTFEVTAGKMKSAPATMTLEVQPDIRPPRVVTQPKDDFVAIGQPATLRVEVSGSPPFSYQWSRNGMPIPRATGPELSIRETKVDDDGKYSVKVTGPGGVISSRPARLQAKAVPTGKAKVPIIEIRYRSPAVEPLTPGVLVITRTGDTDPPVNVKLTSRPGHYPVIPDLHFVPVPSSIPLKAGQTQAEIKVIPIEDTLTRGRQTLTFRIVPNPAYRIAPGRGSAQMIFLDDDCPTVGVQVVKDAKPDAGGRRTFRFTAEPAPRHDTRISYSVSGTATGGVDYEALPGTVTIPAGKTSATVVIKPYRQSQPGTKKTVVLTLPVHRFTFFDFYHYLTEGRPRTASVEIASTVTSPPPPNRPVKPADTEVAKLRKEVARLGWVIFTARSSGPNSDFDLFVMRPDGSQLRNITRTPRFDEFSARVSPDGKRMLYRRVEKGKRNVRKDQTQQDVGTKAMRTWPTAGTLIVANADGRHPRPLGKDGEYEWASWGPKGEQIACLETAKPKEPGSKKPVAYRIVVRDARSLKVIRSLPSGGIQRQAIWSPDGKRICGPANVLPGKSRLSKGLEYPLGRGKMVSIDLDSGKRISMALLPDWSPVWATDSDGDWFQGGSPEILHSANNYGICPAYYSMLWRSGLRGKPSQLVFAEYQKHVWGGCTSPDDKHAIFVIEGETWSLQGKMAIIRLADAPIARGRSPLFHGVLADLFPNLRQGPILDLAHVREGFDPHWTRAEIVRDQDPDE